MSILQVNWVVNQPVGIEKIELDDFDMTAEEWNAIPKNKQEAMLLEYLEEVALDDIYVLASSYEIVAE